MVWKVLRLPTKQLHLNSEQKKPTDQTESQVASTSHDISFIPISSSSTESCGENMLLASCCCTLRPVIDSAKQKKVIHVHKLLMWNLTGSLKKRRIWLVSPSHGLHASTWWCTWYIRVLQPKSIPNIINLPSPTDYLIVMEWGEWRRFLWPCGEWPIDGDIVYIINIGIKGIPIGEDWL